MVEELEPTPAASDVADRLADVAAAAGWPRLGGRLLGLLLLADPPYLSTGQICERLPASKAHVSGLLQLLCGVGLVQRFGVTGSRQAHYRLTPQAWLRATRASFANLQEWAAIAQAARGLVPAGSLAAEQVDQMHGFYTFLADRLPELLDEYEAQR